MFNNTCWIHYIIVDWEPDPQGLSTQIIGYICSAIVIIHTIPASIDAWRYQNADLVPDPSIILRTILSFLLSIYGILSCQLPQFVSGLGSLFFLLVHAAAKIRYRHCVAQKPKNCPIQVHHGLVSA